MKKRMWKIGIVLGALFFTSNLYAMNRILWLDSYHDGYEWTDSLGKGIQQALDGKKIDLKKYHMNTKRKQSEADILGATRQAINLIKAYHPDVVIASDDNVSKYVVMPYFKNAALPIIFCGINNSATQYGYPYKNATGILEQDPIDKLIYSISRFHSVNRVGYLADDTNTSRILSQFYKSQQRFVCNEYFVNTYDEWVDAFLRAQDEVDILIIGNISGIKNWNESLAENFVLTETRIPTGCLLEFLAPYALIGCIKSAEEQGRWAAQTAVKVLEGTPVTEIPIAIPNEFKLIINKRIANKLRIDFPPSYIEKADRIIQ